MSRTIVRVTDEAAARDFSSLLSQVQMGAEVIIEQDTRPVAVLRSVSPHPGRRLSEMIAMARASGSTATLDPEFERDLEAVVSSHGEPLDAPSWD